jgi:hypothetical protein
VGQRQGEEEHERDVLAGRREADPNPGPRGVAGAGPFGDAGHRPGRQRHENEREEVRIADVLRGEDVERIGGQEERGQGGGRSSRQRERQAPRQKNAQDPDRGVYQPRQEEEGGRIALNVPGEFRRGRA